MSKCVMLLIVFAVLVLCSACKWDDVYEDRKDDIHGAIEKKLRDFGITDATEFEIVKKGTTGEALNPNAFEFTYKYNGDQAVAFESTVTIDYDDPEEGSVEPGYLAEDYMHRYFQKQFNSGEVQKIIESHFAKNEVEGVSANGANAFTDAIGDVTIDSVTDAEHLIDKWISITGDVPDGYSINLTMETVDKEDYVSKIEKLKKELPPGYYSFYADSQGDVWETEIYVMD